MCGLVGPELVKIAASGSRIAVNNSSNLHLYSGRAPLADMQANGVAVAMGLDGCALDEDDDGLRELRLFTCLVDVQAILAIRV